MSLLSPLYLLGALAIALPVFFHLIRRTTRRRVPFSSLMFLRRSSPRLTERSRLEDRVLLALRVFVLALLAIGFSRPFWTGDAAAGAASSPSTRTVLVVDTSASMQRADLWGQAQGRVAELAGASGPTDQLAVMTFDHRPHPLFSFEEGMALSPAERAQQIRERLTAVQPGWGDTHLDQALMLAAEWAAGDATGGEPGRREIVVITDLQRGSELGALQAFEWPDQVATRIDVLEPRVAGNTGMQLVADRRIFGDGLEPGLRVRISNSPDATRDQFRLGWATDTGPLAGEGVEAYVPVGQSRVFTLPLPLGGEGSNQVRLDGDAAVFDDTLHVVPPQPARLRIAYLGTETDTAARSPLFFLERAFPATPLLSIQVEAFPPGQPLAPDALTHAALIVATTQLDEATAGIVHAAVDGGSTLLFAPRSADELAALPILTGAGPLVATEVVPPDFVLLGQIDFQHPVFTPFATPAYSDFSGIHFWRYRRLVEADVSPARVLARFDNGDPALVEFLVGEGRVMVLASGWHPHDSQLALSSKFVPFLYSMLDTAEGGLIPTTQRTVGDRLTVPRLAGASATLQRADGTAVPLSADGKSWMRTEEPGIYTVGGGGEDLQFAFNIAASESRTEPLPVDELALLGVPIGTPSAGPAQSADRQALLAAAELEAQQRWWRWLVAAALAVVVMETGLAGRTARHAPPPQGATA